MRKLLVIPLLLILILSGCSDSSYETLLKQESIKVNQIYQTKQIQDHLSLIVYDTLEQEIGFALFKPDKLVQNKMILTKLISQETFWTYSLLSSDIPIPLVYGYTKNMDVESLLIVVKNSDGQTLAEKSIVLEKPIDSGEKIIMAILDQKLEEQQIIEIKGYNKEGKLILEDSF